jgi:hypothetical protein
MVDNHDLLKCLLCEGHGEVRRARLLEWVRNQSFVNSVEDYLSDPSEPIADPPELQEVGAGSRKFMVAPRGTTDAAALCRKV